MINIGNIINKSKKEDLEDLFEVINNVRGLGLDMISQAKSGHPGILLGAAPLLVTLYANHLNVNPKDPKWVNRDRFVLSAGHGSSLLYATLFMSGYDITLDDLKNFRQVGSITPGHPEYNLTPGVDITTGPLGTGLASSVGMAIAESYLREYFSKDVIDYYTYVLCGDGDLMEGISYEAMSLAGHLNLNKLIVLYDSNDISLDGELKLSFSENIKERMSSINWNYILVDDGENITKIDDAIKNAKSNRNGPTLIEVKTTIGKYSELEGTSKAHGNVLSNEDIANIKEKLNLRPQSFSVSQESQEYMKNLILERYKDSPIPQELKDLIENKKILLKNMNYEVPINKVESLRNISSVMLNSIAEDYPFFIGGSADISLSTKAMINNSIFSKDNYSGRTIHFGVREGAMGAIANGIALSNIIPFVSTFMAFSDYLRPSIRLAAMMRLPVIYVFTHDSVTTGEDGPTHQPVEHLVSLRAIPNLDIYRPADPNEVIGTYRTIIDRKKPSVVAISRNNVLIQDSTDSSLVLKGGYVTNREDNKLEGIIISSGEEYGIAKEVYDRLREKGYGIRLVSMPSIELFEEQSDEYKDSVIDTKVKTFVIELSSSYSWYKYTKEEYMFTVNDFGFSGKKEDIIDKLKLNSDEISEKIEKLLST